MALTTGFNPDEISGCLSRIASSYANLIHALHSTTQSVFVDKMAESWACKGAQDTMAIFKENFDSLINMVNDVFTKEPMGSEDAGIYPAIRENGKAWANITGNDGAFTPTDIQKQSVSMDVSNMLENIGGVRGVNKEQADSAISALKSVVLVECDNAVDQAKQAVQQCGFIGNGQAESLCAALNRIGEKIHNDIDSQVQEITNAVNQTLEKYQNKSKEIADAFAGRKA